MLDYAKKLIDCIQSELVNLKMYCTDRNFTPSQRDPFIENSIRQMQDYCIQMLAVAECIAQTRQSSEISQTTSRIIAVDCFMQYTGPKVGLSELGYAFTAMKLFNHGKVSLNMMMKYLEKVFHVDLGNYTATFQDIRNRKKGGNTKFIDALKMRLEDWIDKLD